MSHREPGNFAAEAPAGEYDVRSFIPAGALE